MIRALAVAALLLAAAPASQAAEPPSAIDRCGTGPEGDSTPAVAECIYRAAEVEDARLNRAYRAALARLTPKQQQALRVEQRAWLKGRDDCPFSRDEDGAEFVILVANCVFEGARDRADELERYRAP